MVTTATTRCLAAALLAGAGIGGFAGTAFAAQPQPWQIGLQPAATPIMEMIHRFNNGVLVVVALITLLVLALLLYCMLRFNARVHPVPSRTSHNTLIEVLWTVVPILILVGIAVPSFALLFAEHDPARAIPGFDPETDGQLTIKATGSQWYWTYEYPDNNDLTFDSLLLSEEQRAADPKAGPRLLAVDNEMVVPTGTVVRLQVTGADVIHSFAMPSFGVKIDAVPGRLNESWFLVEQEGMYYGQCSELCGRDHAFMPIAVHAVSPETFAAWVAMANTDLQQSYEMLASGTLPPPPPPEAEEPQAGEGETAAPTADEAPDASQPPPAEAAPATEAPAAQPPSTEAPAAAPPAAGEPATETPATPAPAPETPATEPDTAG